jgi:hypothetical protein
VVRMRRSSSAPKREQLDAWRFHISETVRPYVCCRTLSCRLDIDLSDLRSTPPRVMRSTAFCRSSPLDVRKVAPARRLECHEPIFPSLELGRKLLNLGTIPFVMQRSCASSASPENLLVQPPLGTFRDHIQGHLVARISEKHRMLVYRCSMLRSSPLQETRRDRTQVSGGDPRRRHV